METKFIGVDGFGEIENLHSKKRKVIKSNQLNTAQKTVRFVKRASKLVIKSAVNSNKRSANISFAKASKPNTSNGRRYAQSTSYTGHRAHALLNKKAILAFASCGLVVALSFVTAAGAVGVKNSELPTSATTDMSSPANFNAYIDNQDINYGAASTTSVSTADEAFSELNNNAHTIITKALVEDNLQSDCVGLYIDNEFIGATSDEQALNAALEQVLVDYREGYDDETTTEFANDVDVRNGKFDESKIVPVSEIIANAEGKFSISLATDIVYTREIAYDVTTEYDESQPSSYEKVKTEGENGEEEVTVRTVYVDGVQTDAYETDATVIKEAVDEVVVKGSGSSSGESSSSNESSSSSTSSASSYGSGSFIWPLPYTHNLTSDFGTRWGRLHGGLDISAGGVYGQPIIAADSGTVILAGNQGDGYGNYVIIDHGNGYKTLYGHMSSVAAYTGQQVAQGEVIGYVGSTGNSTGPHLHFEIRVNDVQTDPLQFVSL